MIRVENLRKSYDSKEIIKDISFSVKKGEIFGLLGPNGTGKTTTIKIITKQIKYNSGEVYMFDTKLRKLKEDYKLKIGIMPEFTNLYERLSAYDNLVYAKELYSLVDVDIEGIINRFDLPLDRKFPVSKYSRGMKQKLLFARSIIHDPELIFLDEPTSALDPSSRTIIRKIIKELKQKGKTIFLTTHYMEEAEELCDNIAILMNGKILINDSVDIIKRKFGDNVVEVEYKKDEKFLNEFKKRFDLDAIENFSVKNGTDKIVLHMSDENVADKMKYVIENAQIYNMHSKESDLEEVFLKLTILSKYKFL